MQMCASSDAVLSPHVALVEVWNLSKIIIKSLKIQILRRSSAMTMACAEESTDDNNNNNNNTNTNNNNNKQQPQP